MEKQKVRQQSWVDSLARHRPGVEEVKECFKPVFQRGNAQKAVLFGSCARGEADQYSDIDLLIITESKLPFIERFKDFLPLWQASPVKALDVFVYTPEEFRKMREEEHPFVLRVMEEGELIYEATPKTGSRPMAAAGRKRSGGR